MSVINQVLRDLDARKAGGTEPRPDLKANPAAVGLGRRTGRWRALMISLPALALAGVVVWFGPGLWRAAVKPSPPAGAAEVADSGKATSALTAPAPAPAAPGGPRTPGSVAGPQSASTPPSASSNPSALPRPSAATDTGQPPAGAASTDAASGQAPAEVRAPAPVSMASPGPTPATQRETDPGTPIGGSTAASRPAARTGVTANKRDDGATPAQIERTSLGPLPTSGPDGQYREAMQRYHAGRLDEAARLLQATLKADPSHTPSRQALAAMLIDRRDSRQAQVVLQEGLALDPAQSAFATMSARLSLAAGDAEGAVRTLQGAAVDKAPPELHAMLAGVLSRLRRDREALAHWNAALQRNPGQANWWLGLAVSLEADGRAQDARTAFERALAVPGLRPEAADYARERLGAAR